jgi:hypothetical protein
MQSKFAEGGRVADGGVAQRQNSSQKGMVGCRPYACSCSARELHRSRAFPFHDTYKQVDFKDGHMSASVWLVASEFLALP